MANLPTKNIIFVMGPTAAGKTALGEALYQKLRSPIISVDSALVYRGLNIGSAKPSAQELAVTPHRLIDICDPSKPYSAAQFCRDAKPLIDSEIERGRTPILVGGTMLYFKALLEGLSNIPEADLQVREKLEQEALVNGWQSIHQKLALVDPQIAAKIHPNHSQRVSRAYEVYLSTGKTMSEYHAFSEPGLLESGYNCIQIALAPTDRAVLHKRIETRFDQMLQNGFVDEVKTLFDREDLHAELPAIRAVGYRQVWEYLAGEYSYDEMREKGIIATRQLAKRQLTWLRNWPSIHWVFTQNEQGVELSCAQIADKALGFIESMSCEKL